MIIGLSGKKRSGKSTIANHLVAQGDWQEVSWATPLKEVIGKQLFGLADSQIYGEKKEELIRRWGMSSRDILQVVGTKLFRENFREDFWVVLGKQAIEEAVLNDFNVVVSDCRFPNELLAIKKMGGITVRVVRLGYETKDNHISETALDDYSFDYIIQAPDKNLNYLRSQIDHIVITERAKNKWKNQNEKIFIG